jgi:hypothetical protein
VQFEKNSDEILRRQQILAATPRTTSFAMRFPEYETVCMGNRKQCRCGSPFLSF